MNTTSPLRFQTMLWAPCLLWGIWLCIPAEATTLGDFNPPPKEIEHKLTAEQNALFDVAQTTQGDSREERQLQACCDLFSDETAPYEVRRWAELNQIPLLCFIGQEQEALDVARAWLDEHPDDEMAVKVRYVRAAILHQRGHAGFPRTFEAQREAFQELFDHHDPLDLDVIEAHVDFAQILHIEAFRKGRDYHSFIQEAVDHLDAAAEASRQVVEMPVPERTGSMIERVRRLEKHEQEVNLSQHRLLRIAAYRERLINPGADPEMQAQYREAVEKARRQAEEMLRQGAEAQRRAATEQAARELLGE